MTNDTVESAISRIGPTPMFPCVLLYAEYLPLGRVSPHNPAQPLIQQPSTARVSCTPSFAFIDPGGPPQSQLMPAMLGAHLLKPPPTEAASPAVYRTVG